MRDIVRVHSSSGTTGQITVVGYTQGDIDRWADLMARTFASARASPRRRRPGHLRLRPVHRRPGRALRLRAARRAHRPGLRRQHHAVRCRSSRTSASRCWRARPATRCLIAETALEMGIDVRDLPLRVGVFGAEPWSENMRRQIEHAMGITAIDIYGLSEVMGPGVASECVHQNGLHVFEDHFLIEILDPETLAARAGRRVRRGRVHHAHQGRHPGRPLPHARHLAHHPGTVPVRPDVPSHGAHHRPHRRHAHHPGRERLPEPDRAGPCRCPRGRAALPARAEQARFARPRAGAGGGRAGLRVR